MAGVDFQPPAIDQMVATFCAQLREGSPFVDERLAATDLSVEAAPVLQALYEACCVGQGDEESCMQQAHEALAMMTLLGRRAALAGITPTAALALVPAICQGLGVAGVQVTAAMQRTLTIVAMEGYVAGRDDVHAARLREGVCQAQQFVELAPGVLFWALGGPLEAAWLGDLADGHGLDAQRSPA